MGVGRHIALAEHLESLQDAYQTSSVLRDTADAVTHALRGVELVGDAAVAQIKLWRKQVRAAAPAVRMAVAAARSALRVEHKPKVTLLQEVYWLLHRDEVDSTPGACSVLMLNTQQLVLKSARKRQQNYYKNVAAELKQIAKKAKQPTPVLDLQALADKIQTTRFKGEQGEARKFLVNELMCTPLSHRAHILYPACMLTTYTLRAYTVSGMHAHYL